jgi:hypothetical protein
MRGWVCILGDSDTISGSAPPHIAGTHRISETLATPGAVNSARATTPAAVSRGIQTLLLCCAAKYSCDTLSGATT